MPIDKAISRHELRGLAFRGGGIVVSAVSGLAALKAFLVMNQREAAVLIGLVGYLAFMPIAQLGFGKPCYGEIRGRFVDGTLQRRLIQSFIRMFVWQAGAAAVLFACFAVVFAWSQGYRQALVPVFLFALGQGALGGSTYQRDLAYALSCDPNYENWEFLRRCTLLLSYLTVLVGLPIWFGGILCCLIAVLSQLMIARKLVAVPGLLLTNTLPMVWRDLQPRLGANARRYLAFSLNEQLFYNMPLIVFSVLSAQAGIIYFGIWTKFFMLIVLPMRMVVDARINRQTGLYFKGENPAVWTSLKYSMMLAVGIVFICITGLILVKPILLKFVGAVKLTEDPWLLISLMIWGVGNSIQHVFGSFTVSYRNGFGFALKASLFSLIIVGGVFSVMSVLGFEAGQALLSAGMAYAFCAGIYTRHVWRLLKVPLGTMGAPLEDRPS